MKKIIFILLCLVPVVVDGQIITTIAGCGSCTALGDGGPATAASIGYFGGIAIDRFGNVFIADANNHRVRKIDGTSGIITTIAGTGLPGYSGDGVIATVAQLNLPTWVTFDTAGNLYITDGGNGRIRKVNGSGIISTYAGNGIAGYSGDGTAATAAALNTPQGICFDQLNNLYIVDNANYRVRKVNPSGIISTYAGTGLSGYSSDGGPATSAAMSGIYGICADANNNIYVDHSNDSKVRKISSGTNIVECYVGTGVPGYNGDGMPATSTQLKFPSGIAVDYRGYLHIADYSNYRIRTINASGMVTTVAGNGIAGYSGDGGPATASQINRPEGVAFDNCGNLYIADKENRRVRKVTFNSPPCSYLGVNEQDIQPALSIHPNPTSSLLHIDNVKPNTTYQLLSMVGAVMQSGNLNEGSNTISIQHLPPGMYLLHLTNGAGDRVVKKIIKE